jgi:hypothetical protein
MTIHLSGFINAIAFKIASYQSDKENEPPNTFYNDILKFSNFILLVVSKFLSLYCNKRKQALVTEVPVFVCRA